MRIYKEFNFDIRNRYFLPEEQRNRMEIFINESGLCILLWHKDGYFKIMVLNLFIAKNIIN